MNGNFLDTENNYSFWVEGYERGESEILLGKWMKPQGSRIIPLVAASKMSHLESNLNAASISLTKEQLERLKNS